MTGPDVPARDAAAPRARYRAWYLDGLLAAGQVPNGHDARPLPYVSQVVRVADDGTETIVTLTPPVDDDARLVADAEAEAAAPSPAYRTPTPDNGRGRQSAMQPDLAYIAQRRRLRAEAILAVDVDTLSTGDLLDHTRRLTAATRAYIDVARCLELTPDRRTR
jgi:hypothetical protein